MRPEEVAGVLRAHPHARTGIVGWLQSTLGNGFVQQVVRSLDGSQEPDGGAGSGGLPPQVRGKMEASLGADFSDVRVHASSSRADELGARAFTEGNDLHFAPGEYQPDSPGGQELIGHELAHVVQQREGRVSATVQAKGAAINDDPALEAEADQRGVAAAAAPAPELDRVTPAPASAVARGVAQRAVAGGVIQRVAKEEIEQLVLDDQRDSRHAQGAAAVTAVRNALQSKFGNEATGALALLARDGIEHWPINFAALLRDCRRSRTADAALELVQRSIESAGKNLRELEERITKASKEQPVMDLLLAQYGYDAVRKGVEQYETQHLGGNQRLDETKHLDEKEPFEEKERHEEERPPSFAEFLRGEALANAPRFDLTKTGSYQPPYQEVRRDPNVIESGERTHEGKDKPPMSPNDYIHRHITPSTMRFLFAHPDVPIFVLEGTVDQLLAFTSSNGYTEITRLEDNAQTDFVKYIADDPKGRTCLLVLAASGEAYRRELLAHFTHYEGPEKRVLDPTRIHLMALDPKQDERELDSALTTLLEDIGQIDALVLGKVDEFGTALETKRNVAPLRVIRSTTPPLFGKLYVVDGRIVLSLQIEPGLYASRSGAFMRALLAKYSGNIAVLFTGTAGAVDKNLQVNDLVVPKTFSQVDGLERQIVAESKTRPGSEEESEKHSNENSSTPVPVIDNEARDVLQQMRDTQQDSRAQPRQGRLPDVRLDAEHGSVESILLEDGGWYDTYSGKLHVVEQEVASLISAAQKDLKRLRFCIFFTISDVLGENTFANTEQHQTAPSRFKPGDVLVTALEQMLALGEVPQTAPEVNDGTIQSQIGVGALDDTKKRLDRELRDRRKETERARKRLNGLANGTEAYDNANKAIEKQEKANEQLQATVDRIQRIISVRDMLSAQLRPLFDKLQKLHPKQAKVFESQLHDALIEASRRPLVSEKSEREQETALLAAVVNQVLGLLQSYGKLVSELVNPPSTHSV